jgi:hypothetical protein
MDLHLTYFAATIKTEMTRTGAPGAGLAKKLCDSWAFGT